MSYYCVQKIKKIGPLYYHHSIKTDTLSRTLPLYSTFFSVLIMCDVLLSAVLLKSTDLLKMLSTDEQQNFTPSHEVSSLDSVGVNRMNEEFSRLYMTETLVSSLFKEKLQE